MSRTVWEGVCSECGRPAQLSFVPRDPSNVFCSDCHRQRQAKNPSAQRPRDRRPPGGAGSGLPDGYLRLGYFDSEGHLRKEVLIDEARAIADVLARANLAAVKLMGFYNRARTLKDRLNQTGDFPALRPDLYRLLTDAVDSTGRGITPDIFRQFVERNVELAATDPKSFKEGFVEHLRGVRAWFLLARAGSNPSRR